MWKKIIRGIPETIFKLFMTGALLIAPYFVYKNYGFEPAVIVSLVEVLFMTCAIMEELLFLRTRKQKEIQKEEEIKV